MPIPELPQEELLTQLRDKRSALTLNLVRIFRATRGSRSPLAFLLCRDPDNGSLYAPSGNRSTMVRHTPAAIRVADWENDQRMQPRRLARLAPLALITTVVTPAGSARETSPATWAPMEMYRYVQLVRGDAALLGGTLVAAQTRGDSNRDHCGRNNLAFYCLAETQTDATQHAVELYCDVRAGILPTETIDLSRLYVKQG